MSTVSVEHFFFLFFCEFTLEIGNKKSVESDIAPAGIKSYKFLFVLKNIYFAVFKKLMG